MNGGENCRCCYFCQALRDTVGECKRYPTSQEKDLSDWCGEWKMARVKNARDGWSDQ